MITILIVEHRFTGYSVKLKSEHADEFEEAIASLKRLIPAYSRRYSPPLKEWRIELAAEDCLREWLDYLARNFAIQIEERQGGPAAGGGAHSRRPQPPAQPSKTEQAFATLHLLPSAPPELIKIVYRELAKLNHPDRGGNLRAMQEINAAFDHLAAQLGAKVA